MANEYSMITPFFSQKAAIHALTALEEFGIDASLSENQHAEGDNLLQRVNSGDTLVSLPIDEIQLGKVENLSIIFDDFVPAYVARQPSNTTTDGPAKNLFVTRVLKVVLRQIVIETFFEDLGQQNSLALLEKCAKVLFLETPFERALVIQRDLLDAELFYSMEMNFLTNQVSEPVSRQLIPVSVDIPGDTISINEIINQAPIDFMRSVFGDTLGPIDLDDVVEDIFGKEGTLSPTRNYLIEDDDGILFSISLEKPEAENQLISQSAREQILSAAGKKIQDDSAVRDHMNSLRHELRPTVEALSRQFETLSSSPSIKAVVKKRNDKVKETLSDIDIGLRNLSANTERVENLQVAAAMEDPIISSARRHSHRSRKFAALLPLVMYSKSLIEKQIGKKIKLRVDASLKGKAKVFCYRPNVVSILSRISENAVKYTPNEFQESMLLQLSLQGDRLVLEVMNIGPRLHKDEEKKIFKKRQRGTLVRGLGFPGDGIGLYHAAEIAQIEGLSIEYLSSELTKKQKEILAEKSATDQSIDLTRHRFFVTFPEFRINGGAGGK